jgi:general secretion pathway protein L
MLNLNSEINLDAKKFFRWWKRELAFLVPEKLRQIIEEGRGTILVRPDGDQFDLAYYLDERNQSLAKFDRNEAGAEQYKALLASDERLMKANLVFRLTGKYALQKEIALPAVAAENLYQVISYELSRYTPFTPDQAYFAVKRLKKEKDSDHVRVLLILTDRKILDGFFEDLGLFGMTPVFVDYEDAPNDLDQDDDYYNLLPESLRHKTSNTPRIIYSAMLTTVFLLFLAVFAMPVWFEYRAIQDLEAKIIPIEKEAKKIKALQMEIDSVIDETRKLIDQKNETPAILEMLNTLSTLIKDDTWLTYLQYADGHLQVQGESPAASNLISVLEASELFANARFVSPVTQDNVSKLERFQITVDATSIKTPDSTATAALTQAKAGGGHGAN